MSVPDDLPLSVLEQRLRDAFAAAAEIVAPHSIGDLPRPVDRRGRGASRVLARGDRTMARSSTVIRTGARPVMSVIVTGRMPRSISS